MKIKVVTILFLSFIIFHSCKESNAQEVPVVELISVSDLEETLKIDDVQLVDVRTSEEYASGHIKNAKNIIYQGEYWDQQVAALDKDKPVYVYCAKGGRSAKCAAILEEAGFKKVFDLDGGITKWVNEGNPVD